MFSETHSSLFKILYPETEKMLRNKSNELYTWINTRVKNWTLTSQVTTRLGLSVLLIHRSSLCCWNLHDCCLPRGPHSAGRLAKATGCIVVFLAKYEFLLGCLIKSPIWYIQNLAAILSPQSVPLKVVLFLINATFILLVVQTRKLVVICDSFISLNPTHQKIFLGSVSKYI